MEHLPNDHEAHPNQHHNTHKLWDETGHPVSNFKESQWKLRQQHQNFPMEESHFRILASKQKNKSKRGGLWKSLPGIWVGKLTISSR